MYVIYLKATAKDTNPNFAGEVNHYYYGKRENDITWLVKNDVKRYAREYAFSTKAAACKAKKAHEYEEPYWVNEAEVLTWEEAVQRAN